MNDLICEVMQGDCLEKMKLIADNSVDMILTDPPYGTTANKWDSVIDFNLMWTELNRIIKPGGAIVLFGSEPFSSSLRISNSKGYKYDWVWNKKAFSNQMMAKKQPLRIVENIMVFNTKIYYPQGLIEVNKVTKQGSKITDNIGGGERKKSYVQTHTNYPRNILEFSKDRPSFHPTQKPVDLLKYLINTYTKEGELVLDFTCGVGSTNVACKETMRSCIGIELNKEYCEIARDRIAKTKRYLDVI